MQKIIVQGAGFVGSAFAIACASIKNKNFLFDVTIVEKKNQKKLINQINSGIFPFETNDKKLSLLLKKHIKKNLHISTSENKYKIADIVVSCIGFDCEYSLSSFNKNKKKYQKSIEAIVKKISPKSLLIIQSTLPPGFTNNFIKPILEKQFLKRNLNFEDLILCHSFERVMPGKNYYDSIVNNWRVCAGINQKSIDKSKEFFSKLVNIKKFPITYFNNPIYSEVAKVLENSYRAINIGFIDEWSRFAEMAQIDLFKIIKSIQLRPTHKNMMLPGFGVGGYCLTKDPKFIKISAAHIYKTNKLKFPYMKLGLETNKKMPVNTFNKIRKYFSNKLRKKKILILGVSYKDGVADTRKSPTEILYEKLKKKGALIYLHDPLVRYWSEKKINIKKKLPNFNDYNAVVLATNHDEYKKIIFHKKFNSKNFYLLLDAVNLVNDNEKNKLGKNIKLLSIGK